MEGYKAKVTLSEDGSLHLENLPFEKGDRVEVIVSASSSVERGWPAGYFKETFGAIADASFVRHPQGQFEKRDAFS